MDAATLKFTLTIYGFLTITIIGILSFFLMKFIGKAQIMNAEMFNYFTKKLDEYELKPKR
jgi:hypothetical protein